MASLNLNKVVLCGRLTADPELKQTPSGIAVVRFTLAVNRRVGRNAEGGQAQQQADFISIVAWRQTAEFISRYFRKGSCLCVTGSIQTNNWVDQQGQKHYSTEVIVDDAMFVDSKNESNAGGAYSTDTYNAPSYSSSPASAPKFEELKTDDDLPF